MEQEMNGLVDRAGEGDADAVEQLVKSVKDRVYALAVKMLYHIPDAEDASQEILIKIVTRLGSFRKESAFPTWAMKIAANHLLNKRRHLDKNRLTFQNCEDRIVRDMPDPSTARYSEVEQGLMVNEIRILCVQGLFQCLDWDLRIVYILGQTMDVSSLEGAVILGITPVNFRKRFSRARKKIRGFLIKNCELFDEHNPCKCNVQSVWAVNNCLIDPGHLHHTTHPAQKTKMRDAIGRLRVMEGLSREAALMRAHPDYTAPDTFTRRIRSMLDSGKFRKLKEMN